MKTKRRFFADGHLTSFGALIVIVVLSAALAAFFYTHRAQLAQSAISALQNVMVTAESAGGERLIRTAQYDISVESLEAPLDPGEGGAIETLDDEVVLLTRLGRFYRLDADSRAFRSLNIAGPEDVVAGGVFYTRPKDFSSLGYKDLKLRALGSDIEITVSEARVDREALCVAMAVSQTRVGRAAFFAGNAAPVWREIWRSQPCNENAGGSFPYQAGGDMAFLKDGKIAIFVGDFGVDGHNRKTPGFHPQDLGNDYGKVIAIDPASGEAEALSHGHRNPGGLVVDGEGRLWQSEHGAQGGDEINLIEKGKNYGWPLETYGAHYGMRIWPPDATPGTHDRFRRPVYAFVPSLAMSSLDVMRGEEFPNWRGDLILGTLKHQRLMRLHIREDRVIFAEPIRLGARVRDLVIDDDGVIYAKDDTRPVVYRLANKTAEAPAAGTPEAALAAAGCAACHNPSGAAPSLAGLIGRDVASVPNYSYSAALASIEGAWTQEKLRAYLVDPQAFAPGTTMPAPDLTEQQTDALIATLAD